MNQPRTTWTRWRDRIAGADPGGFSLRIALRAAISLLASATLLLMIGARLALPTTVALVGAEIAMMASAGLSDPTPAEQRRSLAISLVVAALSVVLAALVAGSHLVSGVLFCVIAFVAVGARVFGPRGISVGLMAFMGYFTALYVAATPPQIPTLVGAIALGGAVAYAVHEWVVGERQERVRANVLRAFRARMQRVLDQLADAADAGAMSERRARRIRRGAGRVGEVALALEEAVGHSEEETPSAEVRAWLAALLHAQVALDMLSESVQHITTHETSDERRHTIARLIRALQPWIESGDATARADALRLVAEAANGTTEQPSDATLEGDAEPLTENTERAMWWRLEHAVQTLTTTRPWASLPERDSSRSRVTLSSFRPGGGGAAGVSGMSPDLRLAIQASVAVGLSILAGRAISDTRWYWAVLAAFVVFLRATTLGETISRAWQRISGTVLGVAAGLGVAEVMKHHVAGAMAVGLVAIFFAYYLMRISYTGMIACFTVALALLYETMGRPLPGLMWLRVAETLVGAVIGVAVSALVLPAHSETRVRVLAAGVARAAVGAIERATTPGVEPERDAALHDEIRKVDRALAEVRNALRPLWGPNVPIERSVVTRQGRTSAALAYAIRLFAATPLPSADGERELIRHIGERLARNCASVADALESESVPALVPVARLVARLGASEERAPAAALLADVDAIVGKLAAAGGQTDL